MAGFHLPISGDPHDIMAVINLNQVICSRLFLEIIG